MANPKRLKCFFRDTHFLKQVIPFATASLSSRNRDSVFVFKFSSLLRLSKTAWCRVRSDIEQKAKPLYVRMVFSFSSRSRSCWASFSCNSWISFACDLFGGISTDWGIPTEVWGETSYETNHVDRKFVNTSTWPLDHAKSFPTISGPGSSFPYSPVKPFSTLSCIVRARLEECKHH